MSEPVTPTPLPWNLRREGVFEWHLDINDSRLNDGESFPWNSAVAIYGMEGVGNDVLGMEIGEANARFVHRAVSNHAAILAALKALVRSSEEWNAAVQAITKAPPGWSDSYLDSARAVIAAAEGGAK